MIEPPPRGFINFAASTERYQLPRRLTSTAFVNSEGSVSSIERHGLKTALLTRISSPPCTCLRCAAIDSMCSIRPMWQTRGSALNPSSRKRCATPAQSSALRLLIITCAPACPSVRAMPSPIPIVDPVTSATLPARSNGFARWPVGAVVEFTRISPCPWFCRRLNNSDSMLLCCERQAFGQGRAR
jgi:hypothetical protein